jgi:phosphoribosylglycinamide formyltransferase-1
VNVGVLASGAGTNLKALLDTVHGKEAEIVAVASDKPDAPALDHARDRGIARTVFTKEKYGDRSTRDRAMADWLQERDVELVVLAGYMQLLEPSFLSRFPDRVVNVHPALLPAFPGIDAITQAVAYGVKVFGVTVHLVDEGIDTGPIILQAAMEIPGATDPVTVHSQLRPLEHALLPEAVRLFARGAVRRDPGNPRRLLVG